MKEIWKQIPDFPRYEVSTLGRIRSWASSGHLTDARKGTAHILSGIRRNDGYRTPALRRGGRTFSFRLSRLVLTTFVGKCPKGYQAAHLNGKPNDNRLVNLAWVTRKENQAHRYLHGTALFGELAPWAKLSEQDVISIVKQKGTRTPKEIAKAFGVSAWTIYSIYQKKNWRHLLEVVSQ